MKAKLKAALQIQRDSGGRLGEILFLRRSSSRDVLEILRIRTLDIFTICSSGRRRTRVNPLSMENRRRRLPSKNSTKVRLLPETRS